MTVSDGKTQPSNPPHIPLQSRKPLDHLTVVLIGLIVLSASELRTRTGHTFFCEISIGDTSNIRPVNHRDQADRSNSKNPFEQTYLPTFIEQYSCGISYISKTKDSTETYIIVLLLSFIIRCPGLLKVEDKGIELELPDIESDTEGNNTGFKSVSQRIGDRSDTESRQSASPTPYAESLFPGTTPGRSPERFQSSRPADLTRVTGRTTT
ncbi:hypothetical protein DFH28DRAFT_1120003 [Melampsora americana]|nr:hypothetical protein DFH28DRAFT_1120003 [Melampsora americana]